ncbi:MAG: hypothetical protein R3Y05_02020 [bacterium]
MIKNIKQHPYICLISILAIILGLFLIFAEETLVQSIIFQAVGLGLIAITILKLIKKKQENAQITKEEMINSLLVIIVGVLVMFNIKILLIVGAIVILITPIINIIKSQNKKQQALFESSKLIIGVILLALCFNFIYKILFTILGVLSLGLAGVLLFLVLSGAGVVVSFNPFNNNQTKKSKKDDVIDVEGTYEK